MPAKNNSLPSLHRPLDCLRLCLIADRQQARGGLVETVEAALGAGVRAVQLRERESSTRELFELATRLREATRRHGALLLVNDRADVALAVGADGVHLGWQSMPAAVVRRLVGPGRLVGRSVHNFEEAQRAAAEGVDYIFAGPVYDTPSKAGLVTALGPEGLRAIRRAAAVPVIGLGGIDATNAGAVMEAGAEGVAVIRAILAATDPAMAARDLLVMVGK